MFQPADPERFNPLVWEIVRQIPAGQVSTYGQIASMIPPPEGVDPLRYAHVRARWVGTAMRLSLETDLPWHRVINSRGMISNLPAGRDEQRRRLEAEGVHFDDDERVDFNTVGWEGPPESFLAEHGLFPPRPLRSKKRAPSAPPPPDSV